MIWDITEYSEEELADIMVDIYLDEFYTDDD